MERKDKQIKIAHEGLSLICVIATCGLCSSYTPRTAPWVSPLESSSCTIYRIDSKTDQKLSAFGYSSNVHMTLLRRNGGNVDRKTNLILVTQNNKSRRTATPEIPTIIAILSAKQNFKQSLIRNACRKNWACTQSFLCLELNEDEVNAWRSIQYKNDL